MKEKLVYQWNFCCYFMFSIRTLELLIHKEIDIKLTIWYLCCIDEYSVKSLLRGWYFQTLFYNHWSKSYYQDAKINSTPNPIKGFQRSGNGVSSSTSRERYESINKMRITVSLLLILYSTSIGTTSNNNNTVVLHSKCNCIWNIDRIICTWLALSYLKLYGWFYVSIICNSKEDRK